MSTFDKYKGLSIREIASRLKQDYVVNYLAGDKDDEAMAQLVEKRGPRAGAFAVGAHLFFRKHAALPTVAEACAFWREAADRSKKKENADKVLFHAYNVDEWLAYSGHHAPRNTYKERKKFWPIKLDHMKADETLSMGMFLMAIALDKAPEHTDNCQLIGLAMASQHFHDILVDVGILKKTA